jgi:F0F1-type ATP synthase membrane subunit b/b'
MSTGDSERSLAALTALPALEELRRAGEGFDEQSVRDAFDAFRRHTSQLQAQLRVLQAARKTANVEPTGHAVRMDALHLIRAAAEFADTLERDAQTASATQLQRTEEEVRAKQRDLQAREAEVERYREESERQRAEMLNAAKNEARELLGKAHADATRELREAETRGSRLLEQSRHQATELTNAARAEVEQTLEWARAQAGVVMARAQKGAEQLLTAAGLGEPAMGNVVQAIMSANEGEVGRQPTPMPTPPAEPPVSAQPPAAPAPPPVAEPPVSRTPTVESAAEPAETHGEATSSAPPVTPTAPAEPQRDEPGDAEPESER